VEDGGGVSVPVHREAQRLVISCVVLCALAIGTYTTLRLVYGDRPVYVHVRWAPGVDDAARDRLQRTYGLVSGEQREGRTWGYLITDRSRANIRALVQDPATEDTHNIHRTAFRVWRTAPRLPYLRGGPRPSVLEAASLLFLLAAMAGVGLVALDRAAPHLVRGRLITLKWSYVHPALASRRAVSAVLSWIQSRIPAVSAEAAAVFRIVFGSALLLLLLGRPVRAVWAAEPDNAISGLHLSALTLFTGLPQIVDWIPWWLLGWGALFVAGAFARSAFAMLTLGAFAWALLYTTQTTYHSVCALLITLLCLQGVRWSDAWSFDAWRHGRYNGRGTPHEYGYVTWIPSVVLGVTFAAAAIAKLRDAGLAWVLNGTVKYHFLSDSDQAWVNWGLQLGQHPRLAVFFSFGAIAIELLVIVGVFSGRYWARAAAGAAALMLVTGFALFQGLFWPGWWMLLLAFLPWHRVRPAVLNVAASPAGWRPLAASAIVLTVIGQQIFVTTWRAEQTPLFSIYDMYATTYQSPEEYELKTGETYWIVAVDDSPRPPECQINRNELSVMQRVAQSRSLHAEAKRLLGKCFPSGGIERVFLESRRVRVDRNRWQFLEPSRTQLTGEIPAQQDS